MRGLFSLAMAAILACGLAACGATDGSRAPRLTPEAELPEDYATAWRAWYEEDASWSSWRSRVEADDGLRDFFTDNLIRVLLLHYGNADLSRAGDLPGPFERARRELLHLSESSGPKLVELGFVGDPVVARLCLELLAEIDDARWTLAVAARLEEGEQEERRRAAEWLASLPHAGAEEERVWQALEGAVLGDEAWSVRAQAVLAVGERALATGALDRGRALLTRALSDEDPLVVRSALRALAASRDRRAFPAVLNLLERLERDGAELALLSAAQRCLGTLSGLGRPRSSADWRRWWAENRQ